MPKVFLCHSSQDKDFVRRLASDLNSRGLQYWFDEKEILIGDQIRAKIEAGLAESDFLAVILSPASCASQWVARELDAKLIEEIEQKKVTVLPVLLEDCDLPALLKGKHYADFRKSYDDGLRTLEARFKHSDRELEAKRKLLHRIASLPTPVFDPHLLIVLAVANREFDGAEELIAAHEATHPNCPHVHGPQMAILMSKFETQKTPESFAKAYLATQKLYQVAPKAEHYANLANLASRAPKSPIIVTAVLAHLKAILLEPKSPSKLGGSVACIDVLHRQDLNQSQMIELATTSTSIITAESVESLRPFLGRLLHVTAHLIPGIEENGARERLQHALYNESVKKVEESQEYVDAFLHLAWLAAKNRSSKSVKLWIGRYRLAASKEAFTAAIAKHAPLSDYVK